MVTGTYAGHSLSLVWKIGINQIVKRNLEGYGRKNQRIRVPDTENQKTR